MKPRTTTNRERQFPEEGDDDSHEFGSLAAACEAAAPNTISTPSSLRVIVGS